MHLINSQENCMSRRTFFPFHPLEKGLLHNVKWVVNILPTLSSIIHNANNCGKWEVILLCIYGFPICLKSLKTHPHAPKKNDAEKENGNSFLPNFYLLQSSLNQSELLHKSQKNYMVRPTVIVSTLKPCALASNAMVHMWLEGQGRRQAGNEPGASWARICPGAAGKTQNLWSQDNMSTYSGKDSGGGGGNHETNKKGKLE